MPRTPEQVAADDALTAAIEQVINVYYDGEHPWVLTEYVVVTAQQRWDDDGDSITAVGSVFRDGDVPVHRALGLVEYVGARLRKHISDDDDD